MTTRFIATAALTLTVVGMATPAEAQFGIGAFVRALETAAPAPATPATTSSRS